METVRDIILAYGMLMLTVCIANYVGDVVVMLIEKHKKE